MIVKRIDGCTRVLGKSQGYLGLPIKDVTLNDSVNGPDTPAMQTAWELTPDHSNCAWHWPSARYASSRGNAEMSDNGTPPSKPINGNTRAVAIIKTRLDGLDRKIDELTRQLHALTNQAEGLRMAIAIIEADE